MRRFVVILISLFTFCFCGKSQEAFVLRDGMPITNLSGHYELFTDSTAKLDIDKIIHSENFRKPTAETPSLGLTTSNNWVRFQVRNSSTKDWLLETSLTGSDYVEFYSVVNGHVITRNAIAGIDHYYTRTFKGNLSVFRLEIPHDSLATIYLKLFGVTPAVVLLNVGTEEEFFGYTSLFNLLNGIFFGIILMMTVYNFFLFITDRDKVYIYYVLYTLMNALFIAFINGYTPYLPGFLAHIIWNHHSFVPSVLGIFALLFTVSFLNMKHNAARFYKIYLSLASLVIIAITLDLAGFPRGALQLVQLAGLILSLVSISIGIYIFKKGYRPARFYILGFGAYLAGLFTFILMNIGIIPFNFISQYGMEIGSAFEAMLLSFAIGDKINRFKKEKEKAQLEALASAKENERIVLEQNIILEQKVEERTQEIQIQSDIIEEKNKDILSSIHYAKRIQRALLASDTLLKSKLPEYFILYKPKDIVSGDFYWADETPEGKFLLLTGDCTGHGVPGAFMSLLNISIMHELTFGHHLSRPDQLLNTQRDAIIMSLNPEGADEQSKDGMDCILCSYDFPNKKVEFALANNPLWILRGGEIIEFKPDKQPVGLHEGEKKDFTLHTVQLQSGDIVYTFTDGFADQFGGPKGKKFRYNQLKEKLVSLGNVNLEEQKNILEKTFDDWQGNLEQVDDVLVIGIRI